MTNNRVGRLGLGFADFQQFLIIAGYEFRANRETAFERMSDDRIWEEYERMAEVRAQ